MNGAGRLRLAIVALTTMVACSASGADAMWKAGTASVKITPEKPMWMAGYGGRTQAANGKTTELWAKALVIEDPAGRRAVLVTMDVLGIDRTLSQSICARLKQQSGLRRDQVALSASHTHSGPVVGFNLRPMHFEQVTAEHQALIRDYAQKLEKNVAEAVRKASGSMAPARLSWGSGRAMFAVNRRMNAEGNVPKLRAANKLQGPVDHDVPVLAVHDASGKLKTVVFGYACHATVLNLNQWNGDYPGYAQAELETKHPGAVAMFWAGCGADQNPIPRRTVELAQEYGRQLAEAVGTVLAGTMTPVPAKLQTSYREINLPYAALPTRDQVKEDTKSKDATVAARARLLQHEMGAGRQLSKTYPYPVAEWRLGDELQWVFLGGEVVVDYALRIKLEQRGAKTWVTACANDVMAYIPSKRVLQEGGYEGGGAMVYYGLPASWASEAEQMIIDAIGDKKKTTQTQPKETLPAMVDH